MYGYLLGMLGLRYCPEEKISRRFRLCLLLFLCLFHCGDQAPQADLDGSQIADLIDLQLGVQLAAGFQNRYRSQRIPAVPAAYPAVW